MGACLSSSSGTEIISDDLIDHSATAKVITVDGHLLEYSAAVKAYEVLGLSHPFCFLCSSDDLDRDAPIPPLGSQDSLERGQLYFMLPVESLRGPLRDGTWRPLLFGPAWRWRRRDWLTNRGLLESCRSARRMAE
uniref:Uncharacterized protein n=1 Tax=Ananas comosus var. bracteatus TaxID=296719 RepID=A0A6V7P3J6_ANACO|nr:unnamed protein product [Ananas comosus var. bracteatus]